MYTDVRAINEMVQRESAFVDPIMHEVRKVIVGQEAMIERILIGLLTGGHVLLEGVPGLAKTLTVKTVCDTISAHFSRIQFTPDMLPADVVGTVIYNQQKGEFTAKKGPIFANLVLADEINRAPAKVQSALLEAMQEQQITIGDTTHQLAQPFMVMATQNPVEQEGTYPLPEAQIDRFMLHVKVGHPSRDEEKTIMTRMAQATLAGPRRKRQSAEGEGPPDPLAVQRICTPEQVLRARETIGHIIVDEKINDYIVDVVIATRDPKKAGLKDLAGMVAHGASPRASIALNLASRAHAFIRHRGYVTPEDVKAVGPDVLRHRIILTYEAEAEELTSEQVVRRIFDTVEVP
ncbi:MAG: MoxR family ATPase [Myxococcota bacterium]|nr:MoxR family ATPase [Myxococcota bacterium]